MTDDRVPWEPLPGKARPTPLRASLDHLANTLGLGSVDAARQLMTGWSEIVGDDLAAHCRPGRLIDGILTVRALDRQWATELSWMTTLIERRCNEALGEGTVVEVRIAT